MKIFIAFCLALSLRATANPYPDPRAVPRDLPRPALTGKLPLLSAGALRVKAHDVLRVEVEWRGSPETFRIAQVSRETSGTDALLRRSLVPDPLGSYRAVLADTATGRAVSHGSIGTGQEYRLLTRAITFRFPLPPGPMIFRLEAESPDTGKMAEVLRETLSPPWVQEVIKEDPEVRLVKEATELPDLAVNLYAEGYLAVKKGQFWKDAQYLVSQLEKNKFPGFTRLTFRAVFSPSSLTVGSAQNLGLPVAERDTFLSLYYPYWHPFGRWYHVVYPTRESRYRRGAGLVPYDYPIIIVDNDLYWGVGNFMELTAIPARNSSFTYLLLHEFGHFFGLNEEYESGGKTELAFAPGIDEPWSQNITFLREPSSLKWKAHVPAGTAIPTPHSHWTGQGPHGAYRGGYAETPPLNRSHKPGLRCTMSNGAQFCPVCRHAIEDRIKFDLGE